jgi:hypothetical protein
VTTAVVPPLDDTVATPGSLLDQLTARSVSTFPSTSRSVAVAWVVPPGFKLLEASVTTTVLTAAGAGSLDVTCTSADPLSPSALARIVAEPAPTPVTTAVVPPFGVTVATAALLLDHDTDTSVSSFPDASINVARACEVPPTWKLAGSTTTNT